MCFGSKDDDRSAMPARPAASPVSSSDNNKTAYRPPQQTQYAPPPGPPPTAHQPGPAMYSPATASGAVNDYAPPVGPPPSHGVAGDDYCAPPPGPPPGQHDWQSAVPDTSLFPPPPAIFDTWERSPANNATAEEAEAGADWCRRYGLQQPALDLAQDAWARGAAAAHDIGLITPPGFRGELQRLRAGLWAGRTTRHAADTCVLGYPPLYAPSLHSPLLLLPAAAGPGACAFTAYYEVLIRHDSRHDETSLALGMAALPYPAFRLPGWHRGSLAVHGDDGHRYVNDDLGGHSFTGPFRRGDTYGLGMRFAPAAAAGRAAGRAIDVEVFFTRNGVVDGSWDLHEEVDADRSASLAGLEGFHDISLAIGTFHAVSFEVRLDPALWAYKGVTN